MAQGNDTENQREFEGTERQDKEMEMSKKQKEEYEETERQDKEMVERWKGEADSILVFAGLFSALGAVSFVETYKWLSPDSGDETVDLLAQLVNVTQKIPLTPGSGEPFQRTFDIVAVNVIWFASINICVICAVLATLIQQWVRRYLALAQGRDTIQERMRVREFLYKGLNKYYMPQVCQLLSMGLHLSIGLYAVGFLVFIFHIDPNFLVFALLGFSLVPPIYLALTILPIFVLDFPYSTPFSALAFHIWHFVISPINPDKHKQRNADGLKGTVKQCAKTVTPELAANRRHRSAY